MFAILWAEESDNFFSPPFVQFPSIWERIEMQLVYIQEDEFSTNLVKGY